MHRQALWTPLEYRNRLMALGVKKKKKKSVVEVDLHEAEHER